MSKGLFYNIGLTLMKLTPLKICIIDDVKTYFNEQMLSVASVKGNITFERYYKCDSVMLKNLVAQPRDIIIIDIKGTTSKDVGKDGFDIAKHIYENTSTFVVLTSAHKHHLKNRQSYGDYVLSERLMTPIDFTAEINLIIDEYLKIKTKKYQKLTYKAALLLIRSGVNN